MGTISGGSATIRRPSSPGHSAGKDPLAVACPRFADVPVDHARLFSAQLFSTHLFGHVLQELARLEVLVPNFQRAGRGGLAYALAVGANAGHHHISPIGLKRTRDHGP